jgi:hypothetical protein
MLLLLGAYELYWPFLNLEGQVTVFISTRNRVAQLYPQVLGFANGIQKKIHIYSIPVKKNRSVT